MKTAAYIKPSDIFQQTNLSKPVRTKPCQMKSSILTNNINKTALTSNVMMFDVSGFSFFAKEVSEGIGCTGTCHRNKETHILAAAAAGSVESGHHMK